MPPHDPSVESLICNHIVRVTREYTGRGPTRARAHLAEDLVTVVLQDNLTRGEQSLVDDGRQAEVLAMRIAFQQAMREAYVRGVEELLGRTVLAFLSANHLTPDIAIESFVLTPAPRPAERAHPD